MTRRSAIAAFYRFTPFEAPSALQAPLHAALAGLRVKGSVLLAREGVNGTICAAPEDLAGAMDVLRDLPGCAALEFKLSYADAPAFRRLKVRLKKEIVTLGAGEIDVSANVGTYVDPQDWNALIRQPGTLLVDTRNAYEVVIGTFAGAEDPHTTSFSEFPAWLDSRVAELKPERIAMFCTGGIRCEKATSQARLSGHENVFHLKGGILNYLATIPEAESLWRGECFVFDERVSVGHGLVPGDSVMCRACKHPVTPAGQADPRFQTGVSCPACFGATSPSQKARFAERQRQVELAERRGGVHIGEEA